MADSIVSLINQNLITAISAITTANGYNTNIAYCEQERISERMNDRYPMVILCGPSASISPEDGHTSALNHELDYTLVYYEKINDDTLTDEPATQKTDNVVADLIKGVMADHTRGGYAIITFPTDYYYTIDYTPDGMPMFAIVLTIKVKTILQWNNPYQIG
jgi:hypothetical protein